MHGIGTCIKRLSKVHFMAAIYRRTSPFSRITTITTPNTANNSKCTFYKFVTITFSDTCIMCDEDNNNNINIAILVAIKL